MDFHRGRLIDHIHLHALDLSATVGFYRAILDVLEVPVVVTDTYLSADELWIDEGAALTHVHFAFQAKDHETVKRFYDAGIEAGGRDNGAPGERAYHPGYYAAYLFDPDGNNVEAVYHGPSERSADSVLISTGA